MMKLHAVHRLNNLTEDNGVLFCYSGAIWQDVLECSTDALYQAIIQQSFTGLGGRLITVLIEQIQNMIRYSSSTKLNKDTNRMECHGTIVLVRNGDRIALITCNRIRAEERGPLERLMGRITALNKRELDQTYLERLRSAPGHRTGLGLIDIARKSDAPLEYRVDAVGSDECSFTMQVTFRAA